jgi:hypothetical protein
MQMEALEEKELWYIVQGTKHVPNTGPNLKPMKSYIQKGKVVKAKIILHLDKSQLPHAHFDTAKEIWDNLACIHCTHGFGTHHVPEVLLHVQGGRTIYAGMDCLCLRHCTLSQSSRLQGHRY